MSQTFCFNDPLNHTDESFSVGATIRANSPCHLGYQAMAEQESISGPVEDFGMELTKIAMATAGEHAAVCRIETLYPEIAAVLNVQTIWEIEPSADLLIVDGRFGAGDTLP